jgi:hypothetical protein
VHEGSFFSEAETGCYGEGGAEGFYGKDAEGEEVWDCEAGEDGFDSEGGVCVSGGRAVWGC